MLRNSAVAGLILFVGMIQSAHADQWQYVYDYVQNANATVYNTSSVALDSVNCPQPNTSIGGPGFTTPSCGSATTVRLNLDQFASQNEVTDLQTSFNLLSAQFAIADAPLLQALQMQARIANIGTAQALAMSNSTALQSDENYAVSLNIGTFGGQTAFAGGAVARLNDHVSINAGISAGANGGPVGARAGIRFGW